MLDNFKTAIVKTWNFRGFINFYDGKKTPKYFFEKIMLFSGGIFYWTGGRCYYKAFYKGVPKIA